MAKTTTQLADEVLYDLAVADAGETPDTTDRTRCTDVYAVIYEELATSEEDNYIYWESDENIPDAVFHTMCDLVRLRVQGSFGKPIGLIERQATYQQLLKTLRRIVAVKSSGLPTKAVYY